MLRSHATCVHHCMNEMDGWMVGCNKQIAHSLARCKTPIHIPLPECSSRSPFGYPLCRSLFVSPTLWLSCFKRKRSCNLIACLSGIAYTYFPFTFFVSGGGSMLSSFLPLEMEYPCPGLICSPVVTGYQTIKLGSEPTSSRILDSIIWAQI